MKLYVMSRTKDGEILKPKVSQDFKNLSVEMEAECNKVLKDAGYLGLGIRMLEDDRMIARYGNHRHVWKIDEIEC